MKAIPEFVSESLSDPRQAIVGRVKDFLTLDHGDRLNPASCTMFLLKGNSSDDIEELVKFVSPALRGAAGINIHLDNFEASNNIDPGSISFTLDYDHPDYDAFLNSRLSHWLLPPDRCITNTSTLLIPADSMDDVLSDGGNAVRYAGIDSTVASVFRYIRRGDRVVVDLSLLRPAGTTNSAGLTASGAVSFANIMIKAAKLAQHYTIQNMLSFLSVFNEELRKGGVYKRGALVATLPTDHALIKQFLSVDPTAHDRLFKAVRITYDHEINGVPDDILDHILARYNDGDLWLSKSVYDEKTGKLLRINVCHEVYLLSRQTCDLSSVNLAGCKIEDIAPTTDRLMRTMIWIHSQDYKAESGIYESAKTDKQIGLGYLGLANLLAREGVSYKEFARAIDAVAKALYYGGYDPNAIGIFSYALNPKAVEIVNAIYQGLAMASERAKEYGLDRAFAIAPTASVSFRYQDLAGFTATPEISPPLARRVERTSQIDDELARVYDYGNVEIASEVAFEDYQAIVQGFQMLFDYFDLGQSISFNYWIDMTKEGFSDWLNSDIKTVYYRLKVDNGYQDKSVANTETSSDQSAESDNSYDFLSMFSQAVATGQSSDDGSGKVCIVGDSDCSACAS